MTAVDRRKQLALYAQSFAKRLVPVVSAGGLDRVAPCEVE